MENNFVGWMNIEIKELENRELFMRFSLYFSLERKASNTMPFVMLQMFPKREQNRRKKENKRENGGQQS
uniref:Uncharacterized protein n=1 Tax=Caenorhabditis tropicalis TaxID=1561998 RepID=A0A1I7T459_9PELO